MPSWGGPVIAAFEFVCDSLQVQQLRLQPKSRYFIQSVGQVVLTCQNTALTLAGLDDLPH